ncbi:MAG: hypothetical protein H6709_19395 [Kofleriaceae bacterium]|nr:hypothetical protein [Kofleriaceae bacterium]MCB9574251.1 hypothetical protein [Kofleriaceae bacterium]
MLSWTADAIEVGFPDEFHGLGEMARERDKLEEMKTVLKEHLGHPVELRIKLLSPAESSSTTTSRSLVEDSRAKAAAERHKRETEAREHPVTKLVLDTFGASIKEIKTDV